MGFPRKSVQDKEFIEALGRVIRILRQKRNLKAINMAADIGVTQQTISLWENGKSAPILTHLLKLADQFQLDAWKMIRAAERMRDAKRVFDAGVRQQPEDVE